MRYCLGPKCQCLNLYWMDDCFLTASWNCRRRGDSATSPITDSTHTYAQGRWTRSFTTAFRCREEERRKWKMRHEFFVYLRVRGVRVKRSAALARCPPCHPPLRPTNPPATQPREPVGSRLRRAPPPSPPHLRSRSPSSPPFCYFLESTTHGRAGAGPHQ